VAEQIDVLREGLAGQYEVDRAIGQGGMATVYLARDIRHDRKVAIKVLKPELAASIGHERFLREIKLASQLQHPNILGFYESGEANGLVYYSMPFVEGESLRDRIDKEKQLGVEEAVRIVREAGEALGYAHSHGIIHRDIKPENILLMNGHALVADFGIAKAVEAAGGEKLTETGMAVGTPHYMSPEQALGGTLDGRSDQYSLACVLYECLIGQTPFDGPSPMAVLARHAMEQVPSLQLVRNTIPDSVEDVVFRAMEKTPADRYPSMKEFAEALEDAEADVHVQRTAARRAQNQPRTAQHRTPQGARRATTPIQIESTAPKKKWPVLAGGAVALLALIGGGFFFAKGRGANPPAMSADAAADAKRVAVLYFEDQSPNHSLTYLANGLTEDLIAQLSTVQALDVVSRNGVAAFRDPAIARDSAARALKVGTLVVGSIEPAGPDKVRVTTRLVDASGTEFKRSSFEQNTGDPLAMRDILAGRVSEFLRERLGEEIRVREQRQRSSNPQAWVLVQRAEAQWRLSDSLMLLSPEAAQSALSQADTLLAQASTLDPKWATPLVMRGGLASKQVRLANRDPLKSGPIIDRGLAFVEQALSLDPQDAEALYQRGDLRYWRYLLGLEADPRAAEQLLGSVEKDLQTATQLDPSEARAWASLSHVYYRTKSVTDVNLAARRAYEADAYLSNIDVIIARLYSSSYDLAQFADAKQWCEEGGRRFPKNYRFAECRLGLMTSRAAEPDVARAWRLRDSIVDLAPASEKDRLSLSSQMAVAAVLARASLSDSARHVAERSRGNAEIDPSRDLLYDEALVHVLLGDHKAAFKALRGYLAANPGRQKGIAESPGWQLEALQSDPEWKQVVGAP
jgi:serine/threonine-protein kinase